MTHRPLIPLLTTVDDVERTLDHLIMMDSSETSGLLLFSQSTFAMNIFSSALFSKRFLPGPT